MVGTGLFYKTKLIFNLMFYFLEEFLNFDILLDNNVYFVDLSLQNYFNI